MFGKFRPPYQSPARQEKDSGRNAVPPDGPILWGTTPRQKRKGIQGRERDRWEATGSERDAEK
eukprot:9016044-Pyramimonas_sp.AAC.1